MVADSACKAAVFTRGFRRGSSAEQQAYSEVCNSSMFLLSPMSYFIHLFLRNGIAMLESLHPFLLAILK